MKLNKKILLIVAAYSATMLTGCGGGTTSTAGSSAAASSAASSTAASSAATSSTAASSAAASSTSEGTPVKIWVSETAGVKEEFAKEIDAYAKANSVSIAPTIETVSEANAATQMLTDVDAGADIYCFAQDQFARLVQGGALAKLGVKAAATITADNDTGSVAAVTSGDALYAYPMTSDNGYFMYYDKSVITDTTHLTSMESLIADCEAAGKKWSFEMETSAWYLASFFFGTGCHSNWTTDSSGKFTAVDDTFDSDKGIIAARAMQTLVKSTSHNSSSSAADFTAATPSAIVVSGTWDYNNAQKALGDNLGVAPLPSFVGTDKNTYHLGSYSGFKLMGVKPQTDATKASLCSKLAQYLTSQTCQEARFDAFAWGPSNKAVQAMDKVKANPALSALLAQNAYSTPQGQIHGSWWDIAKVIGSDLIKAESTDAGCKTALDSYKAKIDALFQMSDAEKRAFTVIGKIASVGCNWDSDIAMTEDPTNTWTSAAITLAEGDEFKVRQGKGWDVAFGNAAGTGNYVVTAAEAGSKKIQLVTTADSAGKLSGTVSLIAA